MIKSFVHKELNEFFETGSDAGIRSDHLSKMERILDRLNSSVDPLDMNLPGYGLCLLKGDRKDMWSVTVDENRKVKFFFEGQDAYHVDCEDY